MSSIVKCPHCRGQGFRDHGGEEILCGLCTGPEWTSGGWLQLPLEPFRADYVYANADRAETEDLVCQEWDREGDKHQQCGHCIGGEPCIDCYRDMLEAEERNYGWKMVSW